MSIKNAFLIAVVFGASGCVAVERPLNETGAVVVEVEPAPAVKIYRVSVRSDGERTKVIGALRPLWGQGAIWFAHFDIRAETPEGKVIEKTDVRIERERLPAGAQNRNQRAVFISELEFVAPKGTVLRVTYHKDPHVSPTKMY